MFQPDYVESVSLSERLRAHLGRRSVAVIVTLLEAVLLVVLVVILFLQTWRASIIPLIAVPVSIVGTFAALHLLGFSGDVYGKPMAVEFVARLRETRPFAGVNELIGQLKQDIEHAKRVLGER